MDGSMLDIKCRPSLETNIRNEDVIGRLEWSRGLGRWKRKSGSNVVPSSLWLGETVCDSSCRCHIQSGRVSHLSKDEAFIRCSSSRSVINYWTFLYQVNQMFKCLRRLLWFALYRWSNADSFIVPPLFIRTKKKRRTIRMMRHSSRR